MHILVPPIWIIEQFQDGYSFAQNIIQQVRHTERTYHEGVQLNQHYTT